MKVFECESAEAALLLMEKIGRGLSLLITDVQLAGSADGASLALKARQRYPHLKVIVVSGKDRPASLPPDMMFMPKPWRGPAK